MPKVPVTSSLLLEDHALVRRIRSIYPLSDEDAALLAAMPMVVKSYSGDQDVVRQGDHPTQTCLVMQGVAAMYKITGAGRRQICNFYVAGDIPDLHSMHLETMDSALGTITPCTLGFTQHETIRDLCRQSGALADAFWKMTLIDSAVFREWIVNIGQRDASIRLAHLLCEIYLRSRAIGLADNESCDFPITQQELADATGISVVHVNRMLQGLRSRGLINLGHRRLAVLDWNGLKEAGDFDPTYLHLNERSV